MLFTLILLTLCLIVKIMGLFKPQMVGVSNNKYTETEAPEAGPRVQPKPHLTNTDASFYVKLRFWSHASE